MAKGAFVIEQRRDGGEWFRIWQSCNGADCARYLQTCSFNAAWLPSPHQSEYRMRWDAEADRRQNSKKQAVA